MDAQAIRILDGAVRNGYRSRSLYRADGSKSRRSVFEVYMGVDVSALTSLSVAQNGEVSQDETEP